MRGGPVSGRVTIAIPGEPFAKSRARFTKRGRRVYTDAKTRGHEELLGHHFRLAVKEPYPTNVAVDVSFYRSSLQRIDVDNLMKAVLDAATGIVWADDSQVTTIAARLHLDKENPRTEVAFDEDSESTMPRGTAVDVVGECERCGTSFTYRRYASRPHKRFCSNECVRVDRGLGTCGHCGASYTRRSPSQKYCSTECGYAARRDRGKAALPACQDCGKKLHRRGAVLCRECWLSRPNKDKRKRDFQGAAA